MADYVHRAGRVGRVGCKGTGQVLNFVQTKWDVELLWAIEVSELCAKFLLVYMSTGIDIKWTGHNRTANFGLSYFFRGLNLQRIYRGLHPQNIQFVKCL